MESNNSPSRKRKAISVETKYEIIQCVETGNEQKKDIAARFDILPNTLSTILKNKDKVIESYERSTISPARKRHRSSAHQNVDTALFEWFKEKRNENIPISGPILMAKSEEFANKLGDFSFSANTGWLDRFKERHGIVCRSISGESAVVDNDICEDWLKTKLPNLIRNYKACDIFNADETGLFYKLLPNRTLQMKGETCHGGKKSKERLTVMTASNMDGSEKLKLLVIGKFQNPRCFKGIKSLPVIHRWNKKAWMTSQIYVEWVRNFDKQFTRQKRKVLLFVDNCSAHPIVDNLKSINVQFLPPNTTSKLQPMDQGIIYNLKTKYRQRLIQYILQCDDKKVEPCIHVLKAIRLVHTSWQIVKPICISRCFKKAGFCPSLLSDNIDSQENGDSDDDNIEPQANSDSDDDNDDDVPLANLFNIQNRLDQIGVTMDDLVNVDSDVIATESKSDDAIIDNILNKDSDTDDSEIDDDPTKEIPTNSDGLLGLDTVRRVLETHKNVNEKLFTAIVEMEKIFSRKQKQSDIVSFFPKL